MKQALAFLLFLLTSGIPAVAQNIDAVTAGHYLQGQFQQQRFMKGFDAPFESHGRFTLAPGLGLLWQAETPFAATTIIGPAGLVQEVQGVEMMRLPAARAAFVTRTFDMLADVLSGNWQRLRDDFDVNRSQKGEDWELELLPLRTTGPELPFRRILIKGSRFADIVEIEKAGGDRDLLIFQNQQLLTVPLPAELSEKLNSLGHP